MAPLLHNNCHLHKVIKNNVQLCCWPEQAFGQTVELPIWEDMTLMCCHCSNNTKCLDSLWPNDALWRHRSVSTCAQAMACCLTAPIQYMNQCWPIISEVLGHSPVTLGVWKLLFCRTNLKILLLKLLPHLPGSNELICMLYLATPLSVNSRSCYISNATMCKTIWIARCNHAHHRWDFVVVTVIIIVAIAFVIIVGCHHFHISTHTNSITVILASWCLKSPATPLFV